MPTLLAAAAAAFALCLATWAVAPAFAGDHVGAERCGECHAAEYAQWKQSAHARATSTLTREQQADVRCVSCHAPGREAGLSGVSCESCHGPGKYYAVREVMRDRELARALSLADPDAASCTRCHNATSPALTPFAFEPMLEAMRHWGPGFGGKPDATTPVAPAPPSGGAAPGAPAAPPGPP